MTRSSTNERATGEPPRTFSEYMRSFGPGIVIVLTWLGAGDIVEMATAGADFGYSLMWVLVLAVAMRWVMVSVIASVLVAVSLSE